MESETSGIYIATTSKEIEITPKKTKEKKKVKKDKRIKSLILKCIFILSASSCFLDGFALFFISYNSPIIQKKWNWNKNSVVMLNIIYHLMSGIGALSSTFSCAHGYNQGILYASILSFFTLFFSFPLLFSNSLSIYFISFFLIFLLNGHNQNMCTNLIVEQFNTTVRGSLFALIFFFTQFGRFIFSCIILEDNKDINSGNLFLTIIPILVCISVNFVCLKVLVKILSNSKSFLEMSHISIENKINKKGELENVIKDEIFLEEKEKFYDGQKENIIEKKGESQVDVYNSNQIEENNELIQEISMIGLVFDFNLKINFDFNKLIVNGIKVIYEKEKKRKNFINILFLNISLAIQFFIIVSIYPLISNDNTLTINIIDRIILTKVIETLSLLVFPLVFMVKCIGRKDILIFSHLISMFFLFSIIFKLGDVEKSFDSLRFIWICSFIVVNLYTVEACSFNNRGLISGIMTFAYQISCLLTILIGCYTSMINVYYPISICLIMLVLDIFVVSKFVIETNFINVKNINEFFEK